MPCLVAVRCACRGSSNTVSIFIGLIEAVGPMHGPFDETTCSLRVEQMRCVSSKADGHLLIVTFASSTSIRGSLCRHVSRNIRPPLLLRYQIATCMAYLLHERRERLASWRFPAVSCQMLATDYQENQRKVSLRVSVCDYEATPSARILVTH